MNIFPIYLQEGYVNLYVRYEYDDGFVMSAGTCFSKEEKILSQEAIERLVKQQMYDLAEAEYERRQSEIRERRIAIMPVGKLDAIASGVHSKAAPKVSDLVLVVNVAKIIDSHVHECA